MIESSIVYCLMMVQNEATTTKDMELLNSTQKNMSILHVNRLDMDME
jgi:hypothetical protein